VILFRNDTELTDGLSATDLGVLLTTLIQRIDAHRDELTDPGAMVARLDGLSTADGPGRVRELLALVAEAAVGVPDVAEAVAVLSGSLGT
jgi:hypothetical protein